MEDTFIDIDTSNEVGSTPVTDSVYNPNEISKLRDEGMVIDDRTMGTAMNVFQPSVIQSTKTEVDFLFESELFEIMKPQYRDTIIDGAIVRIPVHSKSSIVDSMTIGDKIARCMKAIQSPETSPEGKIKVADFICDKLVDIYRLPQEKREVIIRELVNVIYSAVNMDILLRLRYLKFRNTVVPYTTSVDLVHKGVRNTMRLVPYFQILKYILRADLEVRNTVYSQEVLDEFEKLFADDEVSLYTKMEIADIFLLNGRKTRGHEMLDVLRRLEYQLTCIKGDIDSEDLYRRMFAVYGDVQNVHSESITESVLSACVNLIDQVKPNSFNAAVVRSTLVDVAPSEAGNIDIVLERIQIDESEFTYKSNKFSVYDVFSSLWEYIDKHPSRTELHKRLIEEMVAMAKYCTSGHVSRFINVIQGYTDDDKLHVRISDAQQIKAVVGHYLDTKLVKAPPEISDAMIGNNQDVFYQFVAKVMNEHIPSLLQEYGEVQEHIIAAVKAYTRYEQWDLNSNGLVLIQPEVDDLVLETISDPEPTISEGENTPPLTTPCVPSTTSWIRRLLSWVSGK
jgi:hypothetical protein